MTASAPTPMRKTNVDSTTSADLHERITQALIDHVISQANDHPDPDKINLIDPAFRRRIERNARDRANAVLPVVVEEQDRRRAYHDHRVANARRVGKRDGEEEAHTYMAQAVPEDDLALIRDRVGDLVWDLGWDIDDQEKDSIAHSLTGCVDDVIGAKHLRLSALQTQLDAVRALHAPETHYHHANPYGWAKECDHCDNPVRDVSGELTEHHFADEHDELRCRIRPRRTCAHCVTTHGEEAPWPCETAELMKETDDAHL